jgi:BirA family biotin operon repressor/biotin-[acetyl-CoA-carboxylase] ligase
MATPYWQIWREEVPSTQDLALQEMGDLPVVVIAAGQSSGRGRSGAEWATAPRALAVSSGLRVDAEESRPISLMAGIAAGRALPNVGLKWPNDLEWEAGKVGGILVERTGEVVVVGLGLNLWWPTPPEGFSALYVHDPGPGRHREIGAWWAAELLAMLRGTGWPSDEYRDRCTTLGRDVTWEPDGSGRAVDVAESGALVVEAGSALIEIHSGAVRQVRA